MFNVINMNQKSWEFINKNAKQMEIWHDDSEKDVIC